MKTSHKLRRQILASLEAKLQPVITVSDERGVAPNRYLAVIVHFSETEFARNFAPGTTDAAILEDFRKDWLTWRLL